ncbi:hypothetical protein [Candidatus Viridilinea mediisalina]|uniref:Uncharacterized protein n=1 Tax=Candidatus Viridilinea mediisalina TaxID=2024553 RepID=A0A2A6RJL1_9CHLR|nr:hypothetical protein [Candidatus Viridilinea mediisalina]PDW03086.1 hypothetical protein CJ255_10580 [Candidatus Viridilinea mediisalina]
MNQASLPTPLTDLRKRAPQARALIREVLEELVGPVELRYEFYREWNGCWKVRTEFSGSAKGRLEFTLLDTPSGGMLALPRPLPERWRLQTGIKASDGTRWTLSETGELRAFG